MTQANAAVNWALGKRLIHWGAAIAAAIALLTPKPDDGEGLLHIAAGSVALALVLTRLVWRLIGDVRPHVKHALRFRAPDVSKGARAYAPLLLQGARLGGFLILALIPVAAGFALAGIGQGEESPLLEAHEAAGTAVMVLAIGHAVAVILFAIIMKYDLINITLFGGARSFSEGGARGGIGLAAGAIIGLAALSYVWGPFDVASKAAALSESEHGEAGEHREYEDD
jgi:cytochrome b